MMKILLVEDEKDLGMILKEELETYGYNITWVENGVDAVLAALDARFDALIVDMVMPNLKGVDTIKIVKKITPDIVVIACSGMIERDMMIDITMAGASVCLNKPFTVAQLIAQIKWATRDRKQPDIPT